jgi:hypothetical protein
VIDPRKCPHQGETAPVDVRSPATGAVATVALICCACLEQLPVWWRCEDCETYETQTFADPTPAVHLGRACQRHAEHA